MFLSFIVLAKMLFSTVLSIYYFILSKNVQKHFFSLFYSTNAPQRIRSFIYFVAAFKLKIKKWLQTKISCNFQDKAPPQTPILPTIRVCHIIMCYLLKFSFAHFKKKMCTCRKPVTRLQFCYHRLLVVACDD